MCSDFGSTPFHSYHYKQHRVSHSHEHLSHGWLCQHQSISKQSIHNRSIGVFLLNAIDAFHYAEILSAPVVFDCEEASCVHVFGVYVHYEVFHVFQLGLPVVVVGEQLPHLGLLGFFEGDVVGVPAQDVLELAFQLVYVLVVLACELELYFFVLYLGFPLFLGPLVEVLFQGFDDAIVVVAVLFPELAELLGGRLDNFDICFTHFDAPINDLLEILLGVGLFIDNEIAFGLVVADVG